MSKYVSEKVKVLVAKRANYRCEYCKIYERHSFLSFHIEHIISLKHGGSSEIDNLAFSCPVCNINKGSDIATFIDESNVPIRFFNPRKDTWSEHFKLELTGYLSPKTKIGEATIKILALNHPDSIIERLSMIKMGIF